MCNQHPELNVFRRVDHNDARVYDHLEDSVTKAGQEKPNAQPKV